MDARDAARALGRLGGHARAQRLSPAERQRIASLGGQARRRSREVARRIDENLRYAAAMTELQQRPRIVRMKTFAGPLPGIHGQRT